MSLRHGGPNLPRVAEVPGRVRRSRQWRDRVATTVVLLSVGLARTTALATPSPAIPWLDRQPPRAGAHPALAPPCRAANLGTRLFLQGATGSLVGGVALTNRGPACALVGWPGASFAGPAAQATHWQVRKVPGVGEGADPLADPVGSLRALAHGKSARVGVVWSNWCGPGSSAAGSSGQRPTALVLRLAGGTTMRLPLTRAPRCDSPSWPSKLLVAPFRPFGVFARARVLRGERVTKGERVVGRARPATRLWRSRLVRSWPRRPARPPRLCLLDHPQVAPVCRNPFDQEPDERHSAMACLELSQRRELAQVRLELHLDGALVAQDTFGRG